MPDDATWQALLDAAIAGDRWRLYGPFSDWLEEAGDWRAAGYRWMHEWEREPWWDDRSQAWEWWSKARSASTRARALVHTRHPYLTWALYWPLRRDAAATVALYGGSLLFFSRQAAEEAVCRAIHEKRYRPRWRKAVPA